jgi:uncharacterized membrane protein YfcA
MPRGKKLNIPAIKSAVMLVLGFFSAIGSALSGIGAQVAAAPMINFLLGYSADKSKGTALAFSLFAAIGAVCGIVLSGVHIQFGIAVLVAIGATIGAILAVKPSVDPRFLTVRRIGQSAGILIGVYLISEGLHQRWGGPRPLAILVKNPVLGSLIVGLITGALSQLLNVASGVFLVPSLIYLVGLPAPNAIAISLTVIALASLLPTLSYTAQQAVDQKTGSWMAIGGAVGGLAGGSLLAHLAMDSPIPFIVFGLITMFLSAWTLSRMT